MPESDQLNEPLICRLGETRKPAEPCSIVIFGASGDLTARKLIPALYHLFKDKQMPSAFRVIGFARREKTDESWRHELREALDQFSRTKPVDDDVWRDFAKNIFYCRGDLTETRSYQKLEQLLTSFGKAPLARKSAVLSGDASQASLARWSSKSIAPICCRRMAPAGSGSWWKNRSGTTSPPPSA